MKLRNLFVNVAAVAVAAVGTAATPALKVNGIEVFPNEIRAARKTLAGPAHERHVDEKAIDRAAVDQIVGRILLAQAAREAKVTLEPGLVAKTIEDQVKKAGGPERYSAGLAEYGLTRADVEHVLSETMLVSKYVQTRLAPEIKVTEADARKYYQENPEEFKRDEESRLRVIVVEVKQGADEATRQAARAKAEATLRRIKAGEDFAAVAKEVSDDASTRSRGGEVGWVERGKLLPELNGPVFALKAGELSGVLESQRGFHVIQAEEHRGARTLPYDEIKEQLVKFLRSQGVDLRVREEVGRLRARATLEVLDPVLKAAMDAAPGRASQAPATATPRSGW